MSISFGIKKKFDFLGSRYAALFGMLIILLFQPWVNEMIMSLGTWIIFFSAFLNFFQIILKRNVDRSVIILLFMMVLSLLSLLASSKISYNVLVFLFCFWEIPIFWSNSTYKTDRTFKKHIYLVFLFLSIYCILLSLSSVSQIKKSSNTATTKNRSFTIFRSKKAAALNKTKKHTSKNIPV